MTHPRRCALALLVLTLWPARMPAAEPSPEQAAQKAALALLATVDAGRYAESWDEAAALFRQALTQAQWVVALQKARITPMKDKDGAWRVSGYYIR